MSSERAKIDTCQSTRDNGGVSSRKGRQWHSPVLVEQEGFQKQLASKQAKIDQHMDWCRSRLKYISGRSPV